MPANRQTLSRFWFGLLAVVGIVGIVLNVIAAAQNDSPSYVEHHFFTPAQRALNQACYFTLQTNLIVVITSLLLAINPQRRATVFKVFRLTGLVGVIVSGVVYHILLSGNPDVRTLGLISTHLLHTLIPLLAIGGWVLFRPPGGTPAKVVWLSLAYPIGWLVFTLIRGAIIGWYPYGFMDVNELGYMWVAVNCVGVAGLLLGLGTAARVTDRWLMLRSQRS